MINIRLISSTFSVAVFFENLSSLPYSLINTFNLRIISIRQDNTHCMLESIDKIDPKNRLKRGFFCFGEL
ncbi:MAG TPA: hypothetical protein DIT25_01090 [Candidatus Moranbacteria bacterium]|nr:hypothetical protein [Candidatus Moranbacteria bacterium]